MQPARRAFRDMHLNMEIKSSLEGESGSFVSPRDLPYLSNNSLAHDLIDTLRWDTAPVCPRCRSKYTKQVNTNVFRQLYRCIDCGYMFNSLAGTIFHGSKMPVNKYFFFFVLHNALQAHLPLRDLSYALDVSHKTASLLMKRTKDIAYPFQFAKVARRHEIPAPAGDEDEGDLASFLSYCEIKSIRVNDKLFQRFLQLLTQGDIPGIASTEADF